MDYIVHGVAKTRTVRSDFHFTFSFLRHGKSHDNGKNLLLQGENEDLGPITQFITT